jgi:nucleotide sugar dehydrogenase
MKNYKIAVAGTGYVGLSLGVLLSQHHQVVAVDIVQAKVDMINNKKSPIQDDYIEKYLAEKELNSVAGILGQAYYYSNLVGFICIHYFVLYYKRYMNVKANRSRDLRIIVAAFVGIIIWICGINILSIVTGKFSGMNLFGCTFMNIQNHVVQLLQGALAVQDVELAYELPDAYFHIQTCDDKNTFGKAAGKQGVGGTLQHSAVCP